MHKVFFSSRINIARLDEKNSESIIFKNGRQQQQSSKVLSWLKIQYPKRETRDELIWTKQVKKTQLNLDKVFLVITFLSVSLFRTYFIRLFTSPKLAYLCVFDISLLKKLNIFTSPKLAYLYFFDISFLKQLNIFFFSKVGQT